MSSPAPDGNLPASVKRLIDRVCDEFESRWASNPKPRIENYLDRVPSGRSVLLFELVKLEVDLRLTAGEEVDEQAYLQRFPDHAAMVELAISGLMDTLSMGITVAAHQRNPDEAREDPVFAIASGDKIGKYTVRRMVGQGGFGIVYLAQHPQLDIDVAIKIPRSGRFRSNLEIERFLEDARHAASLKHPGIVTVHDVDHHGDLLFIVQEFLAGGDLKRSLQAQSYAPEDAARLIATVASAVAHAHKLGIYHRDLKPANILLDESGQPRVADFGLALQERSRRLHKGEICGTPPYMSPEQVRGEAHRIDGRCDVWGLGVMLYEMLVGRTPFSGETNNDVFDNILYTEPTPPRQIIRELPAELERICLKCLARRVTDRYTTTSDLADDLRNWLAEPETKPLRVLSESATRSLRIVPRFLTAFDQEDRDFFLELLPGSRDRDGLPDSIRFWKTRIEQRDPDHTFPVGLLYGPSGCGKSSLVKAGLLPRLGSHVVQVFVETTPDETELRLLKELRKRLPGSSEDVALPELLESIREGRLLPTRQKLLIVFDQFEQWLHTHRADPESQLVQALRQCDGGHLQALLMVRDDFWMGATRFLQELEVELFQGHNVAAVDRFDLRHASKVLQLFGQAYGALPDESAELSRENQLFLNESVQALAEDDRVVSIRLALFAHTVKAKRWTPTTLKEAGGAAGIAVSFLDDTFHSREANPKHRLHAAAVQLVLQQLLPVSGVTIKGQMKSRDELRQASQCLERDFDQVLGTLNDELGLITPTDPLGETLEETLSPDSAGRFYQLTHDYLVPALRQWLTRNQRATRRGRALLLLTDLTDAWNLKEESRQLPTLTEWLSIYWWTRRAERTKTQNRMLRSALRRTTLRAAFVMAGIVLLLSVGYGVNGRSQATAFLNRLLNADTSDLPYIVNELERYEYWITPLLKEKLEAVSDVLPAASDASAERERRQHLHLLVAQARLDRTGINSVVDLLPQVPLEHLGAVASVLGREGDTDMIESHLWESFRIAVARNNSDEILPLGAVLAQVAPNSEQWSSHAALIAGCIANDRASQLGQWLTLFGPIGDKLAPSIVNLYVAAKDRSSTYSSNLLDATIKYATDKPELWAVVVEAASRRDLETLLSRSHPDAKRTTTELLKRLSELHEPTRAAPAAAIGAELRETQALIESVDGFLDTTAAMVPAVAKASFDALNTTLGKHGFRAVSVRPFLLDGTLNVAAAWRRDGRSSTIQWNLRASNVDAVNKEMREQNLVIIDIARYQAPDLRWVAVWSEPENEQPDTRIYLHATLADHQRNEEDWPGKAFAIERFGVYLDGEHSPRCYAIWKKSEFGETDTFTDWRYTRAFGDLSPGHLQTDCRFVWLKPEERDRLGFHKHLSRALAIAKDTPSKLESDAKLLTAARFLSAMGRYKEAVPILREVAGRRSAALVHEQFGVLYGRSGNASGLKMAIDRYAKFEKQKAEMLLYLRLRAAILSQKAEEVSAYLAKLRDLHETQDASVVLTARAYAAIARDKALARKWPMAQARALELLRTVILNHEIQTPETLIFDIDFDSLRGSMEFSSLVTELGFHQRYCAAYGQVIDTESKQLFDLLPDKHRREALSLRRQGYTPWAVSVGSKMASSRLKCCSVWHRRVLPLPQRLTAARRRANLTLALAKLRRPEEMLDCLLGTECHDAKSDIMTRAPKIVEPTTLVEALQTAESDQHLQSLLLTLGGYDLERFSQSDGAYVVSKVETLANASPAGLRSAAVWCLTQWGWKTGASPDPPKAPGEPPGWYVNPAGQVMIELTPPDEFLMGSPEWEAGRGSSESLFWAQIGRRYSLAATETTYEEFQACLEDDKVKRYLQDRPLRLPRHPITGVNWRDAAMFCQWLSEIDPEVSEDQYCYPGIWDADAKEIDLPDDYLTRTGYRLPRETEWEWAARAGSTTSRASGYDDTVLTGFEWFSPTAGSRAQLVGTRRPNRFGFFDMLGNVHEWCDNLQRTHTRSLDHHFRRDEDGNTHVPNKHEMCVLRGGSYKTRASELRSANRTSQVADYLSNSVGFRVARTLPSDQ